MRRDQKMAPEHLEVNSDSTSEVSGQNARRKFLKMSGRVAVAAPAAVLLLAAANKSAHAQVPPYTINGDDTADITGPA
jgi:hypothetical protein